MPGSRITRSGAIREAAPRRPPVCVFHRRTAGQRQDRRPTAQFTYRLGHGRKVHLAHRVAGPLDGRSALNAHIQGLLTKRLGAVFQSGVRPDPASQMGPTETVLRPVCSNRAPVALWVAETPKAHQKNERPASMAANVGGAVRSSHNGIVVAFGENLTGLSEQPRPCKLENR